jgi:hypothetical protein
MAMGVSRPKAGHSNTLIAEQLVYEKKSGKREMAGNNKSCLFHKDLIFKKGVYHHEDSTPIV